jgi:hypothetical protein
MASQSVIVSSHYRWRWLLVLLGGLSWLSIGCNPQSLSMLLMPFNGDNGVEPEYKLFAKDKEITLAILCNFTRPDFQPDLQPAETELADLTAQALRKRCAENKHKIKIVPSAQVRSQQLKMRLAEGEPTPVELGKSLKADYVLDLTILSISLYEKLHHPPMYRGKTELAVNLYKVDVKDGEHRVFNKDYARIYPEGSGPIDAGSMALPTFRRGFLSKVGIDITKMFIAYAPDESHQLE